MENCTDASFPAKAARLLAVQDYESDYINFLQGPQENIDIYEMKKKIRKFLLERDFLETCDYYNRRSFGAPEITPAIQTTKPLAYEQCYSK